jgi:hypothetical protein
MFRVLESKFYCSFQTSPVFICHFVEVDKKFHDLANFYVLNNPFAALRILHVCCPMDSVAIYACGCVRDIE